MKIFLPLLAALAVLSATPSIHADEAADKAQILDLEKTCAAAVVKGDFAALKEVFTEDWVLVDSAGQNTSREQIFASLNSGDLKFAAYELGEMNVRVIGDTAVVVGHGHPRGMLRGEFFDENEVFTDTFARIGGKWRCILSHSTELP